MTGMRSTLRRWFATALVAAAGLGLLALPAAAQSGTTLIGTVSDESGAPLPGVSPPA